MASLPCSSLLKISLHVSKYGRVAVSVDDRFQKLEIEIQF
jgi:hypothetical protein